MAFIKSIVFDFDGVLAESMSIKADAFRYLFRDYPEQLDKVVKLHLDNGGMSRYKKFKIIYRDFLKKSYTPEIERNLDERFSDYVMNAIIKCPSVKGANEFLEKYYNKLKLFVASGTPDKEMVSIVKSRKMSKYFIRVYGSPDSKSVIIKKILREYNFKAEEVVFVGDSINDYEGANESGVGFIGRIGPGNYNPFAGLDKVSGLINDITELGGCIGRMYPNFS